MTHHVLALRNQLTVLVLIAMHLVAEASALSIFRVPLVRIPGIPRLETGVPAGEAVCFVMLAPALVTKHSSSVVNVGAGVGVGSRAWLWLRRWRSELIVELEDELALIDVSVSIHVF